MSDEAVVLLVLCLCLGVPLGIMAYREPNAASDVYKHTVDATKEAVIHYFDHIE